MWHEIVCTLSDEIKAQKMNTKESKQRKFEEREVRESEKGSLI